MKNSLEIDKTTKKKTCMKFKRKLKIQLNWLEREKKKLRKKKPKKEKLNIITHATHI